MEAVYTVKDGEILTGISEYGLIIPDGATITLESAGTLKSIICMGDAKIILSKGSTNIINNEDGYGSAILTMSEKTLTIDGEGALVAFGGQDGECGKIVIKSTVTEVVAIAGDECENNIGAGIDGTCGEVTIEDPTKILDE